MNNNNDKNLYGTVLGACAGFVLGFAVGAAVVAVIDYCDEHKKNKERISKGSDENYISS